MEAYDADELVSYRSLSNLAILAFLFGLLSPLALLVPALIVIPLAGTAVALFAIRNIYSHAGVLTGLTLAKLAVFLCIFILVAVPMKSYVRTQLFLKQADQAARQWLGAITEGDLSAAVSQLTPIAIQGIVQTDAPTNAPPTGKPSIPSTGDAIEALEKNHVVEEIRAHAQTRPLNFKTISAIVDQNQSQPEVSLEYEADSKGDPVSFVVHCVRARHPKLGELWQIQHWKLEDEADHRH